MNGPFFETTSVLPKLFCNWKLLSVSGRFTWVGGVGVLPWRPTTFPPTLNVTAAQLTMMEVTFAVRPRAALIVEESEFCGQLSRYRKRFDVRYAFGPTSFLASKSKHVADIGDDAGHYAGYGVFDIQTSCQ